LEEKARSLTLVFRIREIIAQRKEHKDMRGWKNNLVLLLTGFALLFVTACATTVKPTLKAANYSPVSVETCDPAKSFWKDCVNYPFPVKYKTARDSKGINWEIAYMDEYYGQDPNPKTLVIIHGKGANAAHYGNIMKLALESGLRVIAPDIPNYGKSLPGNLNNPVNRTLNSTREVIYDLVVKQLGVKKAFYSGHSLGGQWIIGYAVLYPAAIDGLILESPAGLEEYTGAFFNPQLLEKDEVWSKVPWMKGALDSEFKKTVEDIKAFYYFKSRDPKTGQLSDAKAGYFKVPNEYATFLTDTRVKMIDANKAEYDRYVITYIIDIYTLGIEIIAEDPNSYAKRAKEIKCPIFLAFGDSEPFIPTTLLSGKKNLKFDIIQPFYRMMNAAGNTPQVKLYAGAGHFPHTDAADQFSNDTVAFITAGKVDGTVNPEKFVRSKYLEDLPADIAAFFAKMDSAAKKQDLQVFMSSYAASFKSDGRDKKATEVIWKQYIGMLTKFKHHLTNIEVKGDKALIAGVVENDFGEVAISPGFMLIKEADGWKYWGNQK
jgi:pimeloyl-ACP methyl ester carboxylesterase